MNIHFAPNTPYFGRMDAQTDRDAIVPSNQKATYLIFDYLIYFYNQFGWHYEACRTVGLPPSHLRRGIKD